MPKVYRIQVQLFAEIELIARDTEDAWERAKEIPITDADWQYKEFELYDAFCIGNAEPDPDYAREDRYDHARQ